MRHKLQHRTTSLDAARISSSRWSRRPLWSSRQLHLHVPRRLHHQNLQPVALRRARHLWRALLGLVRGSGYGDTLHELPFHVHGGIFNNHDGSLAQGNGRAIRVIVPPGRRRRPRRRGFLNHRLVNTSRRHLDLHSELRHPRHQLHGIPVPRHEIRGIHGKPAELTLVRVERVVLTQPEHPAHDDAKQQVQQLGEHVADPRVLVQEQHHHLEENPRAHEREDVELERAIHRFFRVRGSVRRVDVRLP
mmetsp:Transcript_654/g.2519  ORF Transcript_654/g.2519 Transcript_654/m.2519 type:complete len:247 (+) Transcript_654:50-790(+)